MGGNTRLRWWFASCLGPAVLGLAVSGFAQVQAGPITEPRGAGQEPASHAPKGAAAITREQERCSTQLIVNADALFTPHRWTLNPDGSETLDALGPLILNVGAHPARIVAYTAASESQDENQDVAHRRALTVRTWLVNHRFLPENTPIEVAGRDPAVAEQRSHTAARNTERHGKNGTVEIVVDTCRQPSP